MRRLALAALLLLACGDDEPDPPAADLTADVRALQRVTADDLAVLSLEEVENAVAEDLPARAAELLEQGAIPAAERQTEATAALAMSTPEGEALQAEGVAALRARADALETYRAALARGLVEDDLAMLDAIQAQRRAEDAVTAYFDRLAVIRPLDDEEEGEERRRVRHPNEERR